ncbi:MAG: RNA polymerase factor sigma-54 [Lentisphaeria bacterium]|nr:RNA polymerase factor sigma-54 [Lentisphaeria bacterium]
MQLNVTQNLNTTQRLEQTMAPQQLQSLEILQASSLELEQRVLQEIALNPLLELVTPGAEILESDLLSQDERSTREMDTELSAAVIEKDENLASALLEDLNADYLDNYVSDLYHSRPDAEAEERRRHFFDSLSSEPNLLDLLEPQIQEAAGADEELRELCLQIVGNLDAAGYLRSSNEELALQSGKTAQQIARAIAVLQSLYPPGLAARSLRECLLLQLEYNHEKGSIAWDIVDRHLEDLARNRLPLIAKEVDADLEEVREALTRIQQLSPRPGQLLVSRSAPVISPDAFIEKNAIGQWTVRLNYEIIPRVVLNEQYLEKLDDASVSAADKHYIRDKQNAASQLLYAIDQRQSTLGKITEALLVLQREFLEQGTEKMKPLIMATVAEMVGLHEATISRAIANKYVQTPQGLFPFKHFFNTGYSNANDGEEISSRAIKQRLISLINQEDPQKPLSDQVLSDRLKEQGLEVARRTVAKYREEENIPSASLRKVH